MNKTKLPSLISVLILTLITVIMWVSLDVYRAWKSSTPNIVSSEISQKLNPTLDQTTINQIKSKDFLDDSQIPDSLASVSSTPIKTTPVPSPTGQPSIQEESATESGVIP